MNEYGNKFTKITGSKPLETEIVDQIKFQLDGFETSNDVVFCTKFKSSKN